LNVKEELEYYKLALNILCVNNFVTSSITMIEALYVYMITS